MKKDIGPVGLALILGIISVVTALLLGVVNGFTAPVIESLAMEGQTAAFADIFPDADKFSAGDIEPTKNIIAGYIVEKGGEEIGKVILIGPTGFSGPIETAVGFDNDGKITGIKFISIVDTPGIGTQIENESFWGQFIGLSDVSSVSTIGGATVSSAAVKDGISEAASVVMNMKGAN